jgi:hypothetical protein
MRDHHYFIEASLFRNRTGRDHDVVGVGDPALPRVEVRRVISGVV